MKKRALKNALYGHISQLVKAMANGHRLEILDLLVNGPKPVEKIAGETGLSIANASQHLQVLRNANLVDAERRGTYMYYHLVDRETHRFFRLLRDLGMDRVPEARGLLMEYRRSMGTEESLSLARLQETDGGVYLLDVRPAEEFEAGHLPEAHSIPWDKLDERIDELPRDRLIAAYCRGLFCTYADEAVRLLKERGYQAMRLEDVSEKFGSNGTIE